MHIEFTRHILDDSSKRIEKSEYRKDIKSIKHFYVREFKKLREKLGNKEIKNIYEGHGRYKLSDGMTKIIYVKRDGQYLLITYARKTETDRLEGNLLNITRNIGKNI